MTIGAWRGPRGAMEPEDRVRIDAAIETAETINARMAAATEAAEIATEAAAATDADVQATEAGRQQAVQAADAAAAARQAAQSAADTANASISSIGLPIGNPMAWSFARASSRVAWDARGDFEEVAEGQAQGGFDRTGRYLGVMLGRERRNWLQNPNALGAGIGTLTNTTTTPPFPTGWTRPGRNSGIAIDITPITALGRPGLRLRFYAATALTAATADQIEFGPRGGVSAAADQTWGASFFYRLVAGAPPTSTTFRTKILSRNSGGSAVNSVNAALVLDSSWRRAEQVQAMGAGVVDIISGLQMSWATGQQPDFTIEIVAPELAQDLITDLPALPPVASLGPYTRAQDMITVPADALGSYLGRERGALFATIAGWRSGAGWSGIAGLGDGTAGNVMGLAMSPDFGTCEARLSVGGSANAASAVTMTPPAAGAPVRVGFSWGDGQIQVFARGQAGPAVPITVGTPIITQVFIGRLADSLTFEGAMSSIELRPAPVWDDLGAAITA